MQSENGASSWGCLRVKKKTHVSRLSYSRTDRTWVCWGSKAQKASGGIRRREIWLCVDIFPISPRSAIRSTRAITPFLPYVCRSRVSPRATYQCSTCNKQHRYREQRAVGVSLKQPALFLFSTRRHAYFWLSEMFLERWVVVWYMHRRRKLNVWVVLIAWLCGWLWLEVVR